MRTRHPGGDIEQELKSPSLESRGELLAGEMSGGVIGFFEYIDTLRRDEITWKRRCREKMFKVRAPEDSKCRDLANEETAKETGKEQPTALGGEVGESDSLVAEKKVPEGESDLLGLML